MFSLRTKLILVLSAFVLVLLGVSAFVFIREKQQDVTYTTFRNTQTFAELMSEKIVNDYENYFLQENRVYFQKEVQEIFSKNPALKNFQITDYEGKILYQSADTKENFIKDEKLLSQIQSRLSSSQTEDGRVLFLKKSAEGESQFVDSDENKIDELGFDERVKLFVAPVLDRYAVIYQLSYDLLDQQIQQMEIRIGMLALFGLLIGIIFAFFFSVIINRPVQKLVQSSSIIAQGDLAHRVDLKTGDEFEILGQAFNSMAENIEKKLKDTMYRERVTKEFELATQIQNDILPKKSPELKEFDIAGGLIPAEEIGGDFYDFIELSGNRVLMYVGDVTGHGVPAGLVSAVTNALIFSASQKNMMIDSLIETNKALKSKVPPQTFVTLGMIQWDGNAKTLQYVNAGHEALLQFHAADKKVTSTSVNGIALGMVPDVSKQLQIENLNMEAGDTLVLCSDGISQAWKNEKENYGIARLKRAVSEYGNLPSALAIRNAILSDVKEFTGDYKQMDDMTIVVIKRK